ncbi:MAG TPA: DUF2148 domain-containing protein [bacterium]|nr:DUF2148 domain-containing protein [bacterium]
MVKKEKVREELEGLRTAANLAILAARTAPKARGMDNLKIRLMESKSEIAGTASLMEKTASSGYRPHTFGRDAENIRRAGMIILIGTKSEPIGLDCGFCGFSSCQELRGKKGVCAYNSGDLGIAIGALVSKLADFRVDNRIMYTIGYAVVKNGLLGKDVAIAFGIPLSVSGKNIFFDRTQKNPPGK